VINVLSKEIDLIGNGVRSLVMEQSAIKFNSRSIFSHDNLNKNLKGLNVYKFNSLS